MRFLKKLYVGESVKNPERVKWKLRIRAGQFDIYLITISQNGSNQLECFHNGLLKQKWFGKQDHVVVGIATGYEEALGLIQKITEECIETTGKCDIKAFLLMETT